MRARMIGLLMAVVSIVASLPVAASAAPPGGNEYPVFICPAINTHNPHGTWVVGAHARTTSTSW
jgi:hypothetical protein